MRTEGQFQSLGLEELERVFMISWLALIALKEPDLRWAQLVKDTQLVAQPWSLGPDPSLWDLPCYTPWLW